VSAISTDSYREAGIDTLHKWLAEEQFTPLQLAEMALDVLRERAIPLNAVVNLAPERAREESLAVESMQRISDSSPGPVRGIPYGAKDLLATGNGLPTTWGAAPLRNQTVGEDATVLRLLQQQGAVLTAKLAMVELAGGAGYRQPNASFTGPAKNPWNTEYWTGGSSSGSAAAVACGALPFALGSETRGSILMPAAYCGVVGVRPTYGLVSRHGAMTLSWSMDKIGPIARSVEDCARVMEVIGALDNADPASSGRRFDYQPDHYQERRLRIGMLVTEIQDAEPDVAGAVESTISKLSEIGSVEELTLPEFPYGETARLIIASEAASSFEDLIETGSVRDLTAPESRVVPYTYGTILAKDYIRALRIRSAIIRALSQVFAEVDLLVAPTTGRTATKLDEPFTSPEGRDSGADLNVASNLAGFPALTLPIGLDRRGLPIGLQLVAGPFKDEHLHFWASRLERLIGWDARPPG
jgi:aspartyl-tRNA(Asn)/glutamyl-tRNA(Gln) amidotransferase subunit A